MACISLSTQGIYIMLQGQGLIEMASELEDSQSSMDSGSEAIVRSESSSLASTSYDPNHAELPGAKARRAVSQIKLICIDMDGELCLCSASASARPACISCWPTGWSGASPVPADEVEAI